MAGKKMQIFMSGVLLTLVVMKPTIPVIIGAGLLALVVMGAEHDLSSPSARQRWAGFKRMIFTSATGIAIIAAGLATGSELLPLRELTPAEARHALGFLAAYALALIAGPATAWYHLSMRKAQPTPGRIRCSQQAQPTLRRLAASVRCNRSKVAV